MRVLFGATALTGTMTGIGQYAYQLARGLEAREDVDLTCFYGRGFDRVVEPRGQIISGGTRAALRKYIPGAYRVRRMFEQNRFDRARRERHFDLYHEPSFLALRFDGPTVITAHDVSWIRFPQTHPPERVRAMNTFFEPILRSAALVLTDSEFVKGELLQIYGCDANRIVAVPLGIDPLFRPYTERETRPLLEPRGLRHGGYFVSVGTLEPRKNMQATVRAYAALAPALRRRFPLVVAGMHGWGTSSLQRLLAPLVASGEVQVLGYLDREDLAKVTGGAVAMVYPSLYEGFGLPPLEAMGCGVPTIVSTAGSLLEVVGDCGLTVDPHDVDGLATAMTRMAHDPQLRETLASRSLARAAGFTWARCVDQTVNAYRLAVANFR